MKWEEILKIAKQFGIGIAAMKRDELIRSIQKAEGNFDCFGSAVTGECDRKDCAWRTDCLSIGRL